jgi:hypothetical protein
VTNNPIASIDFPSSVELAAVMSSLTLWLCPQL